MKEKKIQTIAKLQDLLPEWEEGEAAWEEVSVILVQLTEEEGAGGRAEESLGPQMQGPVL